MAKKPARRAKQKKTASVKDLKPRQDVKGGLSSTRLGLRSPLGIS